MTSFASKHASNARLFLFDIPEHFTYKDLAKVAQEYGIGYPFKLKAIYINRKGKFGPQPVLATENELVNAPHHMMDGVNDILADAESVNMINDGVVGFKLYTYENSFGQQFGVEWIDIEK